MQWKRDSVFLAVLMTTDTAYPPLTDFPTPLPPPSAVERICRWIPILGWIIAASLELKRRRPKRKHIEQQLAARRESTSAAWGTDPARLRIVQILSEELQREFGWPSKNFLPGDRLDLLFWRDYWDAEVLFFVFEAGKRLDVDLVRDKHCDRTGTLGQFVDRVHLD